MRHARLFTPRHRRAWWQLWRSCRCGHRCRPATPKPAATPPQAPAPVELTETERAEIRALTSGNPPTPPTPPAPNRPRSTNQRPAWNAPTRPYLTNGRPGALTPGQEHRAPRGGRA